MATRGGKRPGAGRKKGFRNKVNADIKARLDEAKCTPLEVMTRVMQSYLEAADKIVETGVMVGARLIHKLDLLDRAADIAAKAAPYIHPKLQNIEHSGKGGGPVKHDVTLSVQESYMRMVKGQ